MIDIIDAYFCGDGEEFETFGDNSVKLAAIKSVLPIIIRDELTPRQRVCLKLRYWSNMSQEEIAKKLKLSQPTVCRHIANAKETVNNKLRYCLFVLNTAENELAKMN